MTNEDEYTQLIDEFACVIANAEKDSEKHSI